MRNERGFTLLEGVVTLAVLGAALLLAAGLLRETQVLAAAAGRGLTDPLSELTTARLRVDLQGADRVLSVITGGVWSNEALELSGDPAGTLLRWERAGDELHRLVVAADGSVLGRQVWMRRVTAWRWRAVTPRLVDLELRYRRAPEASDWRLAGGPPTPPPDRVSVERMRLALRGEGWGASW